MKNLIEIKNLNLTYGPVNIFTNFNFQVPQGQIIGLYGPTGWGKTSLLNKIAQDYMGQLKISYVFQDNKLIDNLTVKENVQLPLNNLFSKADASGRALEYLKLFNMDHKADEKADVLSGGEKQRVNLARAFAYPCHLMLLDEPFSAQDKNHREKLLQLSQELLKKNNITAVVVSHNINELEKLCHSIKYC